MKIFSYNRVNDINLRTEKMWFQYPIIKAKNNRTAANLIYKDIFNKRYKKYKDGNKADVIFNVLELIRPLDYNEYVVIKDYGLYKYNGQTKKIKQYTPPTGGRLTFRRRTLRKINKNK